MSFLVNRYASNVFPSGVIHTSGAEEVSLGAETKTFGVFARVILKCEG